MGWQNPPIPWSELERTLSDRHRPGTPGTGDGGDSPAWSRKRQPYDPPPEHRPQEPDRPVVPYAELHCHTNFSFLDGASHPEELVAEAVRLGLHALAVTDHDGFYGVVRAADAARAHHLPTVVGAELSLGLPGPQQGVADPVGTHLLVLARGAAGHHRLSAAITEAQLRGAEKGRPVYDLEELAAAGAGDWVVLTGCRKGAVRTALATGGLDAASAELERLVALFGRDHVVAELFDHGHPTDSRANDAVAGLAARAGLPVVATGNVHVATPAGRRLAGALAAVRARRSLADMDGWLTAAGAAHLRSGAEMAARFARYPGAVARSVQIADELAFPLEAARPRLPRMEIPAGHSPMSWLRELSLRGLIERFGPPGTRSPQTERVYADRLDRELAVIAEKDFPGYFLIVHDLVAVARAKRILCQGRGSAANSLVCYLLHITAVDPVRFGLPFERFLATTREEEPDIDVDFDSDRREEVIQHVYAKYGRRNAAQVANVITYRPKLAVRDVAKALGHSTGQQDAWSKQVESWGSVATTTADHDIPPAVVELAGQLLGFPRHLGIHSGGMVLTDRPVGEVCPIEHARKEQRTVLQWDKDDCASMGLVKFDLLGLGMLAALQYCFDLVAEHTGEHLTLDSVPKEEPGVYDMLCRADSIGVFQVESRAQMGTLPRLRPREFYHLVIEIALIRPGPIQGGAVHPYIRRKLGQEPVTYPHPLLEPVLARTLGVPLFQEQLMQIAQAVGGCSGDDADLLRRAMGSKRGKEKIGRLKETLFAGMASHGITGGLADDIYAKIEAFANFGFAESHSISFALLVYVSSWVKLHHPAAFLAALLRAQPMGFYSPQSLVADARRHGVQVRTPDIHRSGVHADLERLDAGTPHPTGDPACLAGDQPPAGEFDPDAPFDTDDHRRDGAFAVRLGLAGVRSIGTDLATRIVADRDAAGPFASMADLARRVGLTTPQLEALATAGAFDPLGMSRRQALWEAGRAARERPDRLPGTAGDEAPPVLPGMSGAEQTMADLWATAISPDSHPVQHVRAHLRAAGVLSAVELARAVPETRVLVGGVVTHRQRPATAGGTTFLNLEDETGLVNVIVSAGVWARYRRVARESGALVVRGRVERNQRVVNLVADRIEKLAITVQTTSRDFR
ncbi:error-prone DNA polymerase [Klenkia soli]|uniref:Error-prone DNA polymerase n=1 Tax=Klenkia soli TaxID=1052260 RepID=A0A1H0HQE6_9ACTN|nr:error-prone DNA polymerase [Klenkia soli]SDO21357.1 error-prone DNA polymerase [Klenkia soli]